MLPMVRTPFSNNWTWPVGVPPVTFTVNEKGLPDATLAFVTVKLVDVAIRPYCTVIGTVPLDEV